MGGAAGSLATRATAIHSVLDPIARNPRSTAVLSTNQGVNVLAAGGRDLSPVQRALARVVDIVAADLWFMPRFAQTVRHQHHKPNNSVVVVREMEPMRTYDEPVLLARLEPLDREAKTAFAASCAQLLFPLFERYSRVTGAPAAAERLASILAAAWHLASRPAVEVQEMEADATSMVPDEDHDGWVLESAYGQNGAAAVSYALSTWRTDDPQRAVWAARQVYEVADYAFWQTNPNADANEDGPALRSEFVQAALSAIDKALDAVASGPPLWDDVRQQAEVDGRSWAATFP